eukprot:3741602-Pyramimonas_sp.AAC.1
MVDGDGDDDGGDSNDDDGGHYDDDSLGRHASQTPDASLRCPRITLLFSFDMSLSDMFMAFARAKHTAWGGLGQTFYLYLGSALLGPHGVPLGGLGDLGARGLCE